MPTFAVQIADWMKTPEFQKRHTEAVEARDKADFECFQLLRELAETQEVLNKRALLAAIKTDPYFQGEGRSEAEECAEHFAGEVKRVLKLRADADREYGDCIRNIPKRD